MLILLFLHDGQDQFYHLNFSNNKSLKKKPSVRSVTLFRYVEHQNQLVNSLHNILMIMKKLNH